MVSPGLLLADRLGSRVHDCVAVREGRAAGRADDRALQVAADVGEFDTGGRGLIVLQCPLLGGAINLAQVVDAGVHVCRRAGSHEVGMAIAASKPMRPETIMISTKVKPPSFVALMFIQA